MKLTLISAQLGVDGGIASSHTIRGPQLLSLRLTKLSTVFPLSKMSHRQRGLPGTEVLGRTVARLYLHRSSQMKSIPLGMLDMSYQIVLVGQPMLGKKVISGLPWRQNVNSRPSLGMIVRPRAQFLPT